MSQWSILVFTTFSKMLIGTMFYNRETKTINLTETFMLAYFTFRSNSSLNKLKNQLQNNFCYFITRNSSRVNDLAIFPRGLNCKLSIILPNLYFHSVFKA
jgi:hypothetical protein